MKRSQSRPAKLTSPRVDTVLARTRLFDKLDALSRNRVLWIDAPGGAGKTTLVSSWIAARRRSALWVHIDEGDADPATFFHYLAAAARLAQPRRRVVLPTLTPEHRPALGLFARNFARRLFAFQSGWTAIVLDNYQDLPADSPVHELVALLASEAPETTQVVVISRTRPDGAFARHQANGELGRVGAEDLRLLPEEALQLAAARGEGADAASVSRLNALCDGWTAGFVLLLRALGQTTGRASSPAAAAASAPALTGDSKQTLFEYFAREVFARAPQTVQQFLLQTAVFDTLTVPVVAAATDNPRAGRWLEDLVRRGFFTVELAASDRTYRYHPLFHGFLRERAVESVGPEGWKAFQSRALAAMIGAQHWESAAALASEIGAFSELDHAIGKVGAELIAQGRNPTLLRLLGPVPEPVYDGHPWLRFWRAAALMATEPERAIVECERAWDQFDRLDDPAGLYLAFAQIAEALLFFRGFTRLAQWLPKLDTLRQRHPDPPSREIEMRLVSAAYAAWAFWNPTHPSMAYWEQRALPVMADSSAPPAARLGIGTTVLMTATWFGGGRELALRAHALLDPAAAAAGVPPIARIIWLVFRTASTMWYAGRDGYDATLALCAEAKALSDEHGIHVCDHLLRASRAYAHLNDGDPQKAVEAAEPGVAGHQAAAPYEESHAAFVSACALRAAGQIDAAAAHADRSVALSRKSGAPTALVYSIMGRALVREARGQWRGALADAGSGRRLAERYGFRAAIAMGRLTSALVALGRRQERRARPLLGAAFEMMAREKIQRLPGMSRADFSRLCDTALRLAVKAPHVIALVRDRSLPAPPGAGLEWPWPVKVRCLGRFDLEVDSDPVTFKRKLPKKPIDLFKFLIAAGPEGASGTSIADALWPERDGDAAQHAFAMAVLRLRRMIGDASVLLRDGVARINRERVGIDAWIFESLADSPQAAGDEEIDRAIALYAGQIFPGEGAAWALAPRRRLRERFRQVACERMRRIESAGAAQRVLDLALRAIDLDETAEVFHRFAILAYLALGQNAEAVAAFRRCERSLATGLGTSASASTRALLSGIGGMN